MKDTCTSEQSRVELAVITDGGFFIPTVVMLSSAKRNKAAGSRYRVHFFSTRKVTEWKKNIIMQLASEDFEIKLHTVSLTAIEQKWDKRRCIARISGATMVRLRLHELLPNVERLLYLDGDILVRKDLTALYQEAMGDALIAAAIDLPGVLSLNAHKKLGINNYVNAGVLLMNLDRLRKVNPFTEEALEAAMNNPNVKWMDQDIINLHCDKSMYILHHRYNTMLSLFRENFTYTLTQVNEFYGTSYECWEEMEDNSVILHMAGGKKPWKLVNVLHSEVWMDAYRHSPCAHLSLMREANTEKVRAEIRSTVSNHGQLLALAMQYKQLRRCYHYYKFMSMLTWGRKKKHYKEKRRLYSAKLREIRKLFRDSRQRHGV